MSETELGLDAEERLHALCTVKIPQRVALAALFLASESSSWITGITLDVAGGRVTG